MPHGEPGLCCVRPDGLYAASFTDLIAVLIWEGLGESPTICSCRITQRLSVTYNGGGVTFSDTFLKTTKEHVTEGPGSIAAFACWMMTFPAAPLEQANTAKVIESPLEIWVLKMMEGGNTCWPLQCSV